MSTMLTDKERKELTEWANQDETNRARWSYSDAPRLRLMTLKLLKQPSPCLNFLDDHDKRQLLENSIERVINSAMTLLEAYQPTAEHLEELKDINLTDWEDLKAITVKIWNNARNEVFKETT